MSDIRIGSLAHRAMYYIVASYQLDLRGLPQVTITHPELPGCGVCGAAEDYDNLLIELDETRAAWMQILCDNGQPIPPAQSRAASSPSPKTP